jgi:hypothetical protein
MLSTFSHFSPLFVWELITLVLSPAGSFVETNPMRTLACGLFVLPSIRAISLTSPSYIWTRCTMRPILFQYTVVEKSRSTFNLISHMTLSVCFTSTNMLTITPSRSHHDPPSSTRCSLHIHLRLTRLLSGPGPLYIKYPLPHRSLVYRLLRDRRVIGYSYRPLYSPSRSSATTPPLSLLSRAPQLFISAFMLAFKVICDDPPSLIAPSCTSGFRLLKDRRVIGCSYRPSCSPPRSSATTPPSLIAPSCTSVFRLLRDHQVIGCSYRPSCSPPRSSVTTPPPSSLPHVMDYSNHPLYLWACAHLTASKTFLTTSSYTSLISATSWTLASPHPKNSNDCRLSLSTLPSCTPTTPTPAGTGLQHNMTEQNIYRERDRKYGLGQLSEIQYGDHSCCGTCLDVRTGLKSTRL